MKNNRSRANGPCPPWSELGPNKGNKYWEAFSFSIITLAVLLAYSNCFSCAMVYDDRVEILANPAMRHLWPPWAAMLHGVRLPARPIPYLSFALNYAIGGGNVFGYHVVNVAIHIVNALLLNGILRRTLREVQHGRELALAVALIWALHPLQTAAVTYIYQRIEALMAFFFLLALYSFCRSVTCTGGAGLAGARRVVLPLRNGVEGGNGRCAVNYRDLRSDLCRGILAGDSRAPQIVLRLVGFNLGCAFPRAKR